MEKDATTIEKIITEEGPAEIVEDETINKVVLSSPSTTHMISNVVGKEALRKVQKDTINDLAEKVSNTFGPMESNTLIIKTYSAIESLVAKYSKDGHTVLKANRYAGRPIEDAIQAECINITSRVEREVGDGTTSAIKMASLIFTALCNIEKETGKRPYALMRSFSKVVDMIRDRIKSKSRELTIQDVYDITMISTNGNEEIASQMKAIYEKYGKDVYIDVAPNTKNEDEIKEYDGMTLEVGYSDVAYVNDATLGVSAIRDAHVYYFLDPIDTREMISLFEKIVIENIMIPLQNDMEPISTVIVSPAMSRDMGALMEQVMNMMYGYNKNSMVSQKPPLLVITNLGVYEPMLNDISRLCGCKPICKYNDPEIQKADIEKGVAPTLDTVLSFYGECELVEAGQSKTKFVNPALTYDTDDEGNAITDENGNRVHSSTYQIVIDSLEGELANAINSKADANVVGNLKRRINSLKANMVDFFVGGMSISDRDAKRDLVEDSVLSCRSAAKNGVGYAANFEGFTASVHVYNEIFAGMNYSECDLMMANVIMTSYMEIQRFLYSTFEEDETKVSEIIGTILAKGCPFNLATEEYDGKVLTSIDTDCVILDSIAKIITLMFTANQAMIPSAVGNTYETYSN